jgi:hypothetical protein
LVQPPSQEADTPISVIRKPQAINWFKTAATLHISKMREFQTILERNGIDVEIMTTTRPGYIVYEDRFQVAAYPFADTPT